MSTGHWDFGHELEATDEQRAALHERVHAGPEFRMLRRRMRSFTFPAAAAALLWYLTFVLLSSYAHDLVATPVLGSVNVGLLLGLGQFVSTFALTGAYVRYARRHLDPLADQIRAQVERPAPPTGTTGATGATGATDGVRVVAVHHPRVPAADGTPVVSAR